MRKMKELFQNLKLFTKIVLMVGLCLTLFGFVVKKAGVYFFWESSWIGNTILLIGLGSLLIDWKNFRKSKSQKTVWNKIGIGIVIFILTVKTIIAIILPRTEAYEIAKTHVVNNAEIIDEIGQVQNISFIPTGGIQVTTDSNGKYGSATVCFILKGTKKHRTVTILVNKYPDTDWLVEQIF
jgi:hypothetical protein